ncbi:MAG: hypothetical protein IT158_29490 [Bryobacterales bacterium]|nr:hypothetical protein [Bryobacterales bacterium]
MILSRFSMLLLMLTPAFGQAIVENAIITSKSGVAASKASGAGASIGGIFRKTSELLGSTPSSAQTAVAVAPEEVAGPERKPQPIDLAALSPAMEEKEILRRFGPPLLRISGVKNGAQLDTLTYQVLGGAMVDLQLRESKLIAVPAQPPAKQ